MRVDLDTEKMTTEEKLEVIETLWSDIARTDSYQSPPWHFEELKVREELARKGLDPSIDWKKVKRDLRDELEP